MPMAISSCKSLKGPWLEKRDEVKLGKGVFNMLQEAKQKLNSLFSKAENGSLK